MLADTIKAVKDAEAAEETRIAEARAQTKAEIAHAAEECRDALEAAEEKARTALSKAREKAAKESAEAILDARGLAKATAQSTGELLKPKAAAAARDVLGRIIETWR